MDKKEMLERLKRTRTLREAGITREDLLSVLESVDDKQIEQKIVYVEKPAAQDETVAELHKTIENLRESVKKLKAENKKLRSERA